MTLLKSGFAINRSLVGALTSMVLLTVLGCGDDDGIGRRYRVSGTVAYQGQPVSKGTVNFSPEDPGGRAATGELQEDGSYTLTTMTPGDGALPGTYRVTISAVEVDLSSTESARGGMYRHDLIAKAPRKDLIPPKYANSGTSGLTAEVEPKTNIIDFELVD